MPLLTKNYSLNEFIRTSALFPDGKPIPNVPGEVAALYLRILCETILEGVRDLWGCPVFVTSGFRSFATNSAIGGSASSQHLRGQAADISPGTALSIEEAFYRIYKSDLPWDQLILERVKGREWIHISCAPLYSPPRREALTTLDGSRWATYVPPTSTGGGAVS